VIDYDSYQTRFKAATNINTYRHIRRGTINGFFDDSHGFEHTVATPMMLDYEHLTWKRRFW